MRVALLGLLIAVVVFAVSGGHVLLLPLLFILRSAGFSVTAEAGGSDAQASRRGALASRRRPRDYDAPSDNRLTRIAPRG
jgi:hypothetical protein